MQLNNAYTELYTCHVYMRNADPSFSHEMRCRYVNIDDSIFGWWLQQRGNTWYGETLNFTHIGNSEYLFLGLRGLSGGSSGSWATTLYNVSTGASTSSNASNTQLTESVFPATLLRKAAAATGKRMWVPIINYGLVEGQFGELRYPAGANKRLHVLCDDAGAPVLVTPSLTYLVDGVPYVATHSQLLAFF